MKKRLPILFFLFLSCWANIFAQNYTVSTCAPTYYAPAGTYLTLADDVMSGVISLPFTFNFFGIPYTQYYISSNGFISFDATATNGCCSGQLLPDPTSPNNLIAATWEDIYPPGGGTVSYQTIGTAPNRIVVVCWNNVPHFVSGNPVFIQIQLYETSNDIRCVLQSMPTDGGLHTCGIENATGTVAYFPVGHNAASWSATNECWLFSPCPQPPAPTASGTTICSGQTATLTATGVVGSTFEWYTASIGGTLLASGASYITPVLTTTTTYYVQQTLAACPSPRTAVTVTVNNTTTGTISPSPITLNACSASPVTATVTISNTGGCPLSWSMNTCDPPLAMVLSNLNANAASVVSQIPTPFTFQAICNACAGGLPDGACGNNICDGGNDMYDGGNQLNTNLMGAGVALNYSNNAIIANAGALGAGGQYFTQLVSTNNLWVFAADVSGLNTFTIFGNNGADGAGNVDATILTGTACGNTYRGFVKRVYNAGDPSINHLIIIKDNGGLSHTFAASTDFDDHTVSGLAGVTRIYHVLFGSVAGAYVSNVQMQNVMNAFIANVSGLGGAAPLPAWASISPTSGVAASGGTSTTTITFDPSSLATGTYNSTLNLTYNGGTFSVPLIFNVGTVISAPTASGTTICYNTAATLMATGNVGATFQWYDAPAGGTLLATGASYTTPILTTTTTYYVQQTLGACLSTRTAVTVTVNNVAAPVAANTTICYNTSATLTTSGPASATFQWYDAATGGTLLGTGTSYTTPILTTTTTYYVQQTVAGCISPRTAVTVTVSFVAAPTAPNVTACYNTSATLTATGAGGATFEWYDAATGGTLLGTGANYITPILITPTTYYVQQTVAGCISPRTAVTVSINAPAPPTAANITVCYNASGILTASGAGGASFQWYDAATGGTLLGVGATYTTPLLIATTIYYVEQTVAGCTSSRTAVTVTVNNLAPPTAPSITICFNTSAMLTATGAAGAAFWWYDAPTGGNLLNTTASYTTPILTTNTTYYVQQTLGGCTSTRTTVVVTINAPAPPTTSGITICYNTTATLNAVGVAGATFQWYNNLIGGTLLGSGASFITPNLTSNTTYYVQQTSAGCISGRTAVTVSINLPVNPTASGTTICPGGMATLTVTGSGGATFQWYNASTGGTLLASGASYTTPALASTTTYYVQQTLSGCPSNRIAVVVTVGDVTPPTIVCPGTQFVVLVAGCSNTLPNYTGLGTKTDNCTAAGSLVTTQSPAAGTTMTGVGTVVVTLTVTDAAGNQASCNFNVNKVDISLPNINCPTTQTLFLGAGCSAALPNYTGLAITSDNCGIASVTQSPVAGTVVNGVGTTAITLTTTDINGNVKTCTFNVNRVDNTPPSLTCPATQTLNVGAGCSVTIPNYVPMASATDNCTAGLTITQSPAAGTVVTGAGTTTITMSASDASGNTGTCTFILNRVDTGLPNITCPATQSLPLDASCSATLPNYGLLATASDGCTGTVTVTQSPAIGTIVTGIGSVSITLTATDASGNTATCTFVANKVDVTPPTVNCPPTSPILTVNAGCSVVLPDYASVATGADNCSPSVTITQSPAPGTTVTGLSATTVTLTATDATGNIGTCTFTVLKSDVTPPTITCPATVTASTDANSCTATGVALGTPTTGDNCTVASITNDAPASFPLGSTTVTWTVTDGAGNTANCTQTVTIQDNVAPVISCPSNITLFASAGLCGAVATYFPTATDNCNLNTLSTNPASGSTFPLGLSTVTVTATDIAGNVSTCTFDVLVSMGTFNVLNTPNINLAADAECTDMAGWTHYFHTPSNRILLSIQKNGNSIGAISSGLQVITATNGNYGTNTAQHIAFPTALYPQNPLWYVVNRYWKVTPVAQPLSPVKVRFYFTAQDTNDLNGSLNPNTTMTLMKMYKINGLYDPNPDPDNNPATYDGHSGVPLALSRSGDGYVEYSNAGAATGQNWALGYYSSDYYAEYEIDMFSGGGGGSGSAAMGALPVELLSFTGKYVQPYNLLEWTTISEENSSYFEVQRWNSVTADFEALGNVGAKGNTQSAEHYQYQDNNPYIGKNTYRLKIVDINGGYGYSNLVHIVVAKDDFFALYPNPAKDEISVELPMGLTDEISLTLYDASGKEISRNLWTLEQNQSIHPLSVQNLAQGMYMYKLAYGDKRYEGKLMIAK